MPTVKGKKFPYTKKGKTAAKKAKKMSKMGKATGGRMKQELPRLPLWGASGMAYIPINVPLETYQANYMDEQSELENVDSTNDTTEEVVNTEEVVEDETSTVDSEDETEKLQATNKRLFERAKKAEAELKELKKAPPKVQTAQTEDRDELRLIAKGLSDEEIEQAKVIAKGKGISLAESLKDSMFIAYQKELKEQQRKEKAKLGASKGSNQSGDETLIKSGMSEAEHKEVWNKVLGR